MTGSLSTRFRSLFMRIFYPSSRSAVVSSHTDAGREGLALSLCSNSSQRCSIRLRSGLCAGQSSSSTPNSLIHVFMDLALCTGAQSCWNRRGASPNCSHKAGSLELSNISWYAEAFRLPFIGTKGPSPAPEKTTPHTIIPPPPNFTLGTMQSDKYRSPGNCYTQTRPSDCQMEKRDSSLQRTRLQCSWVQLCCALHHCVWHFALHLLMYGLDAAARPWKPIPWSFLHTVLELIWRLHEVWRSVAIDSSGSCRPLREYYICSVKKYTMPLGWRFCQFTSQSTNSALPHCISMQQAQSTLLFEMSLKT